MYIKITYDGIGYQKHNLVNSEVIGILPDGLGPVFDFDDPEDVDGIDCRFSTEENVEYIDTDKFVCTSKDWKSFPDIVTGSMNNSWANLF